MWTAANLQQEKHCFFGAAGGVSEGIYKGLNNIVFLVLRVVFPKEFTRD